MKSLQLLSQERSIKTFSTVYLTLLSQWNWRKTAHPLSDDEAIVGHIATANITVTQNYLSYNLYTKVLLLIL
ncbi:MAG: hypothetical protein LBD84_01745 [Campylobacteraceae bacterium]|nr:hypothetical protein [Campylobacteraceae bacterium]